jgi:hypothetical protein
LSITIPLPLRGCTATLISAAPGEALPALVSTDPSRRQWTISADGAVLRLTLRTPEELVRAAVLLGPAHELAGQPLSLHLLLALLVRGATVDAATAAAATILAQLVQERAAVDTEAAPPESDRAIRAVVQAAVQGEMLRAQGRWNLARALVELGVALWQVRGLPARPFMLGDHYREEEVFLSYAAALSLPLAVSGLPLPVRTEALTGIPREMLGSRMDAWLDWISCAPGPDPFPSALFPDGLGLDAQGLPENRNEELSLPLERAELLRSVARSLLRETRPRPAPRYLHQVLRVSIPRRLRALLLPWCVTGMRVIPHIEGMYVAIEAGSEVRPAAVAWWPADDSYQLKAPKSFPPALWVIVHVIAAAFWRDLHAAVVVVEAAPVLATGQPRDGRRQQPPRGTRTVALPPMRRARPAEQQPERLARWSSPEEEEAIAFFTTQGARYRALPRGWEEREQQTDFQRRRRQAAERAVAEDYPEPEPGFTFVRSHERLSHAAPSKVAVISRGLLRAVLGLEVPLNERLDE